MTEIWRGRVLWRGYVHPHNHPHTQLKKSRFPLPIPSQCGDFPSKQGRVRAIPTGRVYLSSLVIDKLSTHIHSNHTIFSFNPNNILFTCKSTQINANSLPQIHTSI